jgi:hypothetical protein
MWASFGTSPEDSEWIKRDEQYWRENNAGWPWRVVNITLDVGQHFMNEPTHYKSTVSSIVYKVSEGYSMNEQIRGLVTGTTATEFLGNIIKKDENQALTLKASADGSELAMDAIINNGDMLEVLSADSTNTTKYLLEVTDAGLSSNALLTSERFDITIESQPKSADETSDDGVGSITGFEYGTTLSTIMANVTVPVGASMNIINGEGAYVPLKTLNFDTAYVNVTVNSDTYFDVLAEDGITRIVYQLKPEASQSEAFVTSDAYEVMQRDLLIQFVPRGTVVQSFLNNVVPSLGASIKLVDKNGLERTEGNIVQDDKLVVTSPDGTTVKVYFLSMLATEYIPQTTYLAYILSKQYGIDQVNNVISGVSGNATLSEFYDRIEPADGATAVVVDKDGMEKTAGDIDGSDMLKVTSADGKIVVMYSFGNLTSSELAQLRQIELYPNPTNSKINIAGLESGNRIRIFNATGTMIFDVNALSNLETISLNEQPSGMYLIVVTNERKLLGSFKALKK